MHEKEFVTRDKITLVIFIIFIMTYSYENILFLQKKKYLSWLLISLQQHTIILFFFTFLVPYKLILCLEEWHGGMILINFFRWKWSSLLSLWDFHIFYVIKGRHIYRTPKHVINQTVAVVRFYVFSWFSLFINKIYELITLVWFKSNNWIEPDNRSKNLTV